jgi:hypothetical protein
MHAVDIEDVCQELRVLLGLGPVNTLLHASYGTHYVYCIPQLPEASPHPPSTLSPARCQVGEQHALGFSYWVSGSGAESFFVMDTTSCSIIEQSQLVETQIWVV